MPSRKRKSLAPDTPLTPVPAEILDQFVIGHDNTEQASSRIMVE